MTFKSKWYRLFTISLLVWFGLVAVPSKAQTSAELDEACPIPYVVSNQQSVVQGYLQATAKIADAIPAASGLAGARLDAMRATVRGIIAGQAEQALADLRDAYLCRLRMIVPENKHAHAAALMSNAQLLVAASMVPGNWSTVQSVFQTYRDFNELLAVPAPGLYDVAVANRVTPAELRRAIGNPDFRSRTATRASLEANAFGIGGGICRGAVEATVALVDVATIAALASHHTVLENLLSQETRPAAQSRILVDARSIVSSNSEAQVISSIQAATDPADVQRCFNEVVESETTEADVEVDDGG